jgi:hypothetical protein
MAEAQEVSAVPNAGIEDQGDGDGDGEKDLMEQRERQTLEKGDGYDIAISAGRVVCLDRIERRFPRMVHFLLKVMLPLTILIFLSFIFGFGLAKLESGGEIAANNNLLRESVGTYLLYTFAQEEIRNTIEEVQQTCLAEYDGNLTFTVVDEEFPELFPYLGGCYANISETQYPTKNMTSYILDELAVEFSFNWIACPKQEVEGGLEVNNVLQGVYYILAYLEDYKALLSKAKEEGSLVFLKWFSIGLLVWQL